MESVCIDLIGGLSMYNKYQKQLDSYTDTEHISIDIIVIF